MSIKPNSQLDIVVKALEKVNNETNKMILQMCNGMNESEVIQSFNQQALDLFSKLLTITKRTGKESEYKVGGYKALFDNAIKINARLPLDKFTLVILEFAPDIYQENEDCFLNMSIPDANVKLGNEFSIIRSEMFKSLWKDLSKSDKAAVGEIIILMTTYAHIYFYKTLLLNNKN